MSQEAAAQVATYTPNTAIITGAAQGIGRAIAVRLAEDGFDVTVNDVAEQAEKLNGVVATIRAKGRKALAVLGDVSVEDDVKQLVEKTVEELGGLDVMVANAGIAGSLSNIWEIDMDSFDRLIAINLRGVMLCYKHASRQMIAQKRGGRLIAASSVAGKKGIKQVQAYSASKAGVRALSQSIALELLPYKITVNAYCPGVILTDMSDSPRDASIDGKHGSFIKTLFGATPDAPDAEPEVIASLVSYLCKPEAYFINGQSINVCGGLLAI